MSKEEIKEAIKTPDFKYVELGSCWSKHQGNDGGFALDWSATGIGFGQIAFYRKGRKIYCDTEYMSKEFVEKVMNYFLNNAVKYDDK